MFGWLQDLIEALYAYQQSFYYKIHFVLFVAAFLAVLWLYKLEWDIKRKQANPTIKNCSTKVKYFDYVTTKQRHTDQEVKKLQESKEYQQFMAEKNVPGSRYNRRGRVEEEVSDIQLSDDSDEDARKKR